MKTGIQSRLLLTTTLVLSSFLFLAGFVLDRSFQESIRESAKDQLELVIYSLMGAALEFDDRLRFSNDDDLKDTRLNQPESGWYAMVERHGREDRWRSQSARTTGVEFLDYQGSLNPGQFDFREHSEGSVSRFFLTYAVIWEDEEETLLTFQVAADQEPFVKTIRGFRRNLYLGLGGVTVFFVLAQYLAVRWGLLPLRVMAGEVRELEDGKRERLSESYPVELTGLAQNLDRFIAHEQRSRSRYRRAMEDLAHSLKTPLAVIRNALHDDKRDESNLLSEQLDRMESTVTYQLTRASVAGPVTVGRRVDIGSVIDRLLRALRTAYVDRNIDVELQLETGLTVRGDERDLMEMLGNLLENAFKYTDSKILIRSDTGASTSIYLEDNGPGIAPELREDVLNRGTRADEIQQGQGIGLAVVAELVELYHGKLSIGESRWGGAEIRLDLP
ncbi:MAG: ATP-binding protein [Gammaproteobacteria bacterium]|nr:ATP-binding protein [Gammaproteobacteria bacterium]MCZ6853620.1 ATP-binding protein [Gammaproteobacteria bacterium]